MRTVFLSQAIVALIVVLPLIGSAIDESLVLFFPFEEGKGNVTEDKSDNGNTGTLVNEPTWVEGKEGTGLRLSGTSYLNVKDEPTLDGMSELTIELWVNFNDSNTGTIVTKNDWAQSFHSHLSNGGGIYWGYDGVDRINAPNGTAVAGKWMHLAFQFDGPKHLLKIYKNGEEVASGDAAIKEIPDTEMDFDIGDDRGVGLNSDSTIDEVAVYRKALSEEEIKRDMGGIEGFAVRPSDRLTTTWGRIKRNVEGRER